MAQWYYMGIGSGIMASFIFYLGTILEAFILQRINQDCLYNDAGKKGYKIKIEDDDSILQLAFLVKFIPVVNLLEGFYHIINYNLNKDKIIAYIKEKNLMETFTRGDMFYYLKNENINRCREIADRYYMQRKEPYYIIFVGEYDVCKVSYVFDFPYRDIIILDIEGTMENLDLEEQKRVVKETIQKYEEVCINKCGGLMAYYDAVREGYFNPEKIVIKTPNFLEEKLNQKLSLQRKKV